MYIILKYVVDEWVLTNVLGGLDGIDGAEDEDTLESENNELVNRIVSIMKDQNLLGKTKGGFMIDIKGVDYRGVYSVEGNTCTVVIVNHRIEYEKLEDIKYDKLTGLEGKISILNHIEKLISSEKGFQIYLFDIDNFRSVNDVYGSRNGDEIILSLVKRILHNLVSNYSLYRYGGDTFALVREGPESNDFSSGIMNLFEDPFLIENKNVYITVSAGYVNEMDFEGVTPEVLLDRSHVALNHAKTRGKNMCIKYDDKIRNQSAFEMEIDSMIREALREDQFELYYQPQFSLSSNKVIGAEALIRWNHPERGFISPIEFIPIAEKNGLVVQIGEWVVRETCRQLREWINKGIVPVRIGVNIGSLHFNKGSFVRDILRSLREYDISPDLLGLEITEGSVISDEEDMIVKLGEIRDEGIKVSIDDFGTGYSSLSYLQKFPIDTLKIDQSFILNIPRDHDNVAIVKAIINLAKNMNLKVIAEGVETEAARDLLRKLDCHDMQGYLFSKPVNKKDFEEKLLNE